MSFWEVTLLSLLFCCLGPVYIPKQTRGSIIENGIRRKRPPQEKQVSSPSFPRFSSHFYPLKRTKPIPRKTENKYVHNVGSKFGGEWKTIIDSRAIMSMVSENSGKSRDIQQAGAGPVQVDNGEPWFCRGTSQLKVNPGNRTVHK